MANTLKPSVTIHDTSHRESLMITGKKKEVMFQTIVEKADEIYKNELEELKALKSEENDKDNSNNNLDTIASNLKMKKMSS